MKTLLAAALAATLLLAGCSSDDDDSTSTGADSGSSTADTSSTSDGGDGEVHEITGDTTITAEAGSSFTLSLEANATTGYQWSQSVDGDAVTKTGEQYVAPDTDRVGAGGTQEYTYDAESAGTATISLTYAQVGSGDVGEAYTVTVEVG